MSILSQQDFDQDQLKEHIRMIKARILKDHPEYIEKLLMKDLSCQLNDNFHKNLRIQFERWIKHDRNFLIEQLLNK